jgi:hypothetical protein
VKDVGWDEGTQNSTVQRDHAHGTAPCMIGHIFRIMYEGIAQAKRYHMVGVLEGNTPQITSCIGIFALPGRNELQRSFPCFLYMCLATSV